jgi:hypothetical protein
VARRQSGLCFFQLATRHCLPQKCARMHPLHFLNLGLLGPPVSIAPHPAHFGRILHTIVAFPSRIPCLM